MMTRKTISVEVIEEQQGRIVVTTYTNGEVVRTLVDPSKKATRKPRLRRQQLRAVDVTPKKQF